MNDQHAKILQNPFSKMVVASVAVGKLVNDQLQHATTENEANQVALGAWSALNDLFIQLNQQLLDITTDKPCQCAKCQSERAEALAQAEEIFK